MIRYFTITTLWAIAIGLRAHYGGWDLFVFMPGVVLVAVVIAAGGLMFGWWSWGQNILFYFMCVVLYFFIFTDVWGDDGPHMPPFAWWLRDAGIATQNCDRIANFTHMLFWLTIIGYGVWRFRIRDTQVRDDE